MTRHKSIFFLKNQAILLLILVGTGMAGCKKTVEVNAPETSPASASVYTNDATASSVLTSIYAKMAVTSFAQGASGIGLYAGLSADELQTPTTSATALGYVFTNSPAVTAPNLWKELYQHIYVANAAIEGIEKSTGGMTDSVKNQLTGEAKFMRAFLHFYIINLWGDAPLITTTDYVANSFASRTPKKQVYDQIIADLRDAKGLLKDNYALPTGALDTLRARPNKGTASALLARVYLYTGDWANAEAEATSVINKTTLYTLGTDITKLFLKGSKETIWQIQPVVQSGNTSEASMYLLTSPPNAGGINPASLRPAFLSNFEAGDKRRTNWVDSPVLGGTKYYCPSKYKAKAISLSISPIPPPTEYLVVFRLAEQYLIRAEARAHQDKIGEAQADLNAIRTRAGLGVTTAGDQPSLLGAIAHERQVELFTEWGHRWLDLKRTGQVDAVMTVVTPQKGGTWDTNMQLYPIPSNEISLNPNLAPQNPGYK